jgi:hypothetical protein
MSLATWGVFFHRIILSLFQIIFCISKYLCHGFRPPLLLKFGMSLEFTAIRESQQDSKPIRYRSSYQDFELTSLRPDSALETTNPAFRPPNSSTSASEQWCCPSYILTNLPCNNVSSIKTYICHVVDSCLITCILYNVAVVFGGGRYCSVRHCATSRKSRRFESRWGE